MYKQLNENEDFGDRYVTWTISYCPDTNSFFVTNQRHFYWEYDDEFQCENDAINYFVNHISYFRKMRNEILSKTGGWSTGKEIYLENTGESYS